MASESEKQQQQKQERLYLNKDRGETESTVEVELGGDTNFNFSAAHITADEDFMRRPRSQAYLDLISVVDLTTANDEEIIERLKETCDEDLIDEFSEMSVEDILEELRQTFEEEMSERCAKLQRLPKPQRLIEVISQCYIGGCDVHSINSKGEILHHYKVGCKMQEEVAKGRALWYKNKNCSCIEVYTNCLRMVNGDGSVTVFDFDGGEYDGES